MMSGFCFLPVLYYSNQRMASGFIILSDGRCLAPRYTGFDYLLELAIGEMRTDCDEGDFRQWLQTRIPSEGDIENGYGGFVKASTNENILRNLDLRELTPANQERFWCALQRAVRKLILARDERYDGILYLLKRILRMRRLTRIKDDPDHLSDWRAGIIEPSTGAKAGPGW
jgi:hypothetical protein